MPHLGHFDETHALTLIDGSLSCYKTCHLTAAYCSNEGGDMADPHRLQLLYDAADASLMLANLLTRASRFHREAARFTRAVVKACAEQLGDHEDPQLRTAYAACQGVVRICDELLDRESVAREDAQDEAVKETFPASDPVPPPTKL